MEHNPIIDQEPKPPRPRYEEIEHPQPLDKKWRDDFRVGEFCMDAFTKAMADYEDRPDRERLVQKRWNDFEHTIKRRLAQIRQEQKRILGRAPDPCGKFERSLRVLQREAHSRDKGFAPFWAAVNELISRPGEHTRTVTKVELKPKQPEPACFEATTENKEWLAEKCRITVSMVRKRLRDGEALGIVDVLDRAGGHWHDNAKIYKLADRKVRTHKGMEIFYKDYLLWRRRDVIVAALKARRRVEQPVNG